MSFSVKEPLMIGQSIAEMNLKHTASYHLIYTVFTHLSSVWLPRQPSTGQVCKYQLRSTWIRGQAFKSARPYESCKTFKGRPRRNAFSKLVHRQYKSFPADRFCQVEMKNLTRLSNKYSNAWSCAEDQILANKNLRNIILNICTERQVKYFRQIY